MILLYTCVHLCMQSLNTYCNLIFFSAQKIHFTHFHLKVCFSFPRAYRIFFEDRAHILLYLTDDKTSQSVRCLCLCGGKTNMFFYAGAPRMCNICIHTYAIVVLYIKNTFSLVYAHAKGARAT